MQYKQSYLSIIFFLLFPCLLNGNIIILGELTHEKESAPGQEYTGSIAVSNVEENPCEVKVYQTDYQFFADGRILYSDPGMLERSNASWITLTPKTFTIPAKETVTIHYTVKVPDDKSLVGTYWSIVMIEGLDQGSPESSTPETEVSVGVQQVFRYGIQMVTHIGNSGKKTLQFTGAKLVKEEKKLYLDVENTGERWLRAHLWAELYDSTGNTLGQLEGGRLRIYPGTSVRFNVDMSEIPSGSYKTLIIIDCGDNDVFGANWNLVLEE